ncbi:hypothetical protein [Micromonospora carbonacea]|uniref:Uncharacterized protein n=1 Tax=Micromonospora carbonacea TaxID=47853 RepID=A0A1C5AZ07_9ACTN|nr:hypothetical protein [Micromonospora carbonacea]SCF50406.1 hypothetical protein GA0070563_13131 [Micromonospora carbonacea]
MSPYVGLPTDGDGCAYSAAIDQPACTIAAEHHVIGYTGGWGWVCLNTCRAHLAPAVVSCTVIADIHDARSCSGEHHAPA